MHLEVADGSSVLTAIPDGEVTGEIYWSINGVSEWWNGGNDPTYITGTTFDAAGYPKGTVITAYDKIGNWTYEASASVK